MRQRNNKRKKVAAVLSLGLLGLTMATYFSSRSTDFVPLLFKRKLEGELEEEEEEEEEEINQNLLSTSIMVIVLVLILLTIAFEEGKEYIEEAGGREMKPIIDSLFGEMTVLGFLSCVTFVITKIGVFDAISKHLFGEEEEELLVEVFETVHFTLFFVMVFFVIQVLILLKECEKTVETWFEMEAQSRDPDFKRKIKKMAIEREETRSHMNPNVRRFDSIVHKIPAKRDIDAEITEDHFVFDSLRDEFLKDRSLEPPFKEADDSTRLSDDEFSFGRYLATCLSTSCSHIVDVSVVTWTFFAFLTLVVYIIDIALEESTLILCIVWVSIGYFFFLFNLVFESYLVAVCRALAFKDASLGRLGLKEVDNTGNSETDRLLSSSDSSLHVLPSWCRVDIDDYMKNRSWLNRYMTGKKIDRQSALQWLGTKGPKVHVTILQINMVFVGLYGAMLILTFLPFMYRNVSILYFILFLLLSIYPAVVLVTNKRRLLATMTKVGAVGVNRKHPAISKTIREEKIARAVRTLIFMYKVNRLSSKGTFEKKSGTVNYRQSLRKVDIDDISKTFDTFDESGDGEISHAEFEALMSKFLGDAVNLDSVKRIIAMLDEDKDGGISKEEFLQWYADHMGDDDLSAHERAHFLFGMFDKEGDGQISIGEFKIALDDLKLGFTVDEVGEIVRELDEDGDGTVSEHEFAELIEKYYPTELGE